MFVPTTADAASRAHPACSAGLTTGGGPRSMVTRASVPNPEATDSVTRRSSSCMSARDSESTARIVPVARARSGMMFDAVPASIVPTVMTPGVAGLSRRETIDCSADTTAASATIGSLASCGRAACAPAPMHLDRERVGGRGQRSVVGDDLSDGRIAGRRVRRRSRARRRCAPLSSTSERALPDLLRRLQHYEHVAIGRVRGQQRRRSDGPRSVDVVSARVHHARNRRRERKSGRLLNRQRVDVAAQRDDRRRARSAPERARRRRSRRRVERRSLRRRRARPRRRAVVSRSCERELRVAMKFATKRHEAIAQRVENLSLDRFGDSHSLTGCRRRPWVRPLDST